MRSFLELQLKSMQTGCPLAKTLFKDSPSLLAELKNNSSNPSKFEHRLSAYLSKRNSPLQGSYLVALLAGRIELARCLYKSRARLSDVLLCCLCDIQKVPVGLKCLVLVEGTQAIHEDFIIKTARNQSCSATKYVLKILQYTKGKAYLLEKKHKIPNFADIVENFFTGKEKYRPSMVDLVAVSVRPKKDVEHLVFVLDTFQTEWTLLRKDLSSMKFLIEKCMYYDGKDALQTIFERIPSNEIELHSHILLVLAVPKHPNDYSMLQLWAASVMGNKVYEEAINIAMSKAKDLGKWKIVEFLDQLSTDMANPTADRD